MSNFEVTSVEVRTPPIANEELTVRTGATRRRLKLRGKRCDLCLSYLSLILAGAGLFTSISSTCICNYCVVNGADDPTTASLGIWMVPHNATTSSFFGCELYPAEMPSDASFQLSRAMSILAPLFCFLGMTMSYFAEVGPAVKQERRLVIAIVMLLIASVMQGLTLTILESDVCMNNPLVPGDGSCGLSYGTNLSIGSVSFMAAATFALLVTGRKDIEFDTNERPARNGRKGGSYHPYEGRSLDNKNHGGDTTSGESSNGEEVKLGPLRHGSGRIRFVDIWGKLV